MLTHYDPLVTEVMLCIAPLYRSSCSGTASGSPGWEFAAAFPPPFHTAVKPGTAYPGDNGCAVVDMSQAEGPLLWSASPVGRGSVRRELWESKASCCLREAFLLAGHAVWRCSREVWSGKRSGGPVGVGGWAPWFDEQTGEKVRLQTAPPVGLV